MVAKHENTYVNQLALSEIIDKRDLLRTCKTKMVRFHWIQQERKRRGAYIKLDNEEVLQVKKKCFFNLYSRCLWKYDEPIAMWTKVKKEEES